VEGGPKPRESGVAAAPALTSARSAGLFGPAFHAPDGFQLKREPARGSVDRRRDPSDDVAAERFFAPLEESRRDPWLPPKGPLPGLQARSAWPDVSSQTPDQDPQLRVSRVGLRRLPQFREGVLRIPMGPEVEALPERFVV